MTSGGAVQEGRKKRESRGPLRSKFAAARAWYVSGLIPDNAPPGANPEPSLVEIGEALGISRRSLEVRSTADGWVALRKKHKESVEAATLAAQEAENAKLVKTMAAQHAKARVAFFQAGLLLQGQVAKQVRVSGDSLPLKALASAGTALARAQAVVDTAVLGPKNAPESAVAVQVNVGWSSLQALPPSVTPHLAAFEED